MTKPGITCVARVLSCAALVSFGLCGCRLLPVTVAVGRLLAAPADRPSVLAVVLGPSSASTRAELMRIVVGSARPGEHLIVISACGGTALGSLVAPPTPRMTGPVFPKSLPQHSTSFQRASYGKKLAHARATEREDRVRLLARQRRELRSWADRAVLRVLSAASQVRAGNGGLGQAVTEAVADVSALQQTGIKLGGRRVIAIIGEEGGAPPPRASLDGATVVVADVARAAENAAWQADFLEAGGSC